ncbi:hypothetical protein [Massilia sp. TSP1-1-2]|uniref:hypothetical protein n=1 Tax=Massilia sp. TSP1-1-2 TaxID=2804649 RepID=UPI003CE71D5D
MFQSSFSTRTPPALRRSVSIACRFITVAALATLAGCAAIKAIDNAIDPLATPLGDPARPVMEQGQGAVASSFEYVMPIQEFAQMGRLIATIHLEAVNGSKKITYLSTGRDVPNLQTKLAHEPNVVPPVLFIHSVPPGKYRIKEIAIGADYRNLQTFQIYDSPDITVVAGQLNYLGNFYVKYMTRFTSKGELVLRHASLSGPHNKFERDIAELKTAEKRLDTVVITNPLVR